VPAERAGEAPLLTLDSGPVSGVTASMFLGAAMGEKNVITTDMGGTSFDVSIIYEGKPAYSFVSNTDQYDYFLPKVDLQAMDWNTVVSRRAKKDPPAQGGWNIFCTAWVAPDIWNPLANAAVILNSTTTLSS